MKTKNMTTLYLRKSIGRLPWALTVCLTLATLGLGLSASANERGTCFITFDAPGAGTGPFQGTLPEAINPAGAIAGLYLDASSLYHGFLRDPDGALTTIDVPGARQTFPYGINPGNRGLLRCQRPRPRLPARSQRHLDHVRCAGRSNGFWPGHLRP